MAFDIFRFPAVLLPQYKPILFPYNHFTRITQLPPYSDQRPSATVIFQTSDSSSYLTTGTQLQHIAGIYFHSYHLQSRLLWPQTKSKPIISTSTVPDVNDIRSPFTSGSRLVHVSREYCRISHLESCVARPETLRATCSTPPRRVVPHYPRSIRFESLPLDVLSGELNDLDVRASDILNIEIGGKGYTDWSNLEPSIVRFIDAHPYLPNQPNNLCLNVDWLESTVDQREDSALHVFESLFALLSEQHRSGGLAPISQFESISISIPALVRDHHAYANYFQRPNIQLFHASSLKEFSWSGHFTFFTSNFRGISFPRLTTLKLSACLISLEDTLTLLNTCPLLTRVTFDTIQRVEDSAYKVAGPRELPNIVLPFLDYMKVVSNVPLLPLFENIEWGVTLRVLILILQEEGIEGLTTYATHFRSVQSITIRGNLSEKDVVELRRGVESLELNGHEIML